MAESKLTDKPVLTTPASGDLLYVVDVSDTTDSAQGSSKQISGSDLFKLAPVTSVATKTGAVVLEASNIFRSGTSGDTVATDLTQLDNFATSVSAILKNPSASVTGLQVDSSNKIEIDSATTKAVVTLGGVSAATIGSTQSLFPALRVGASGSTYDLPSSRGSITGQVPVYNDVTKGSTWQELKVAELDGNSDDLPEGTTNLYFTSAERSKLTGIAAGAEVNVNADWNAVSGDAQILNKPTLATVATTGSYTDLSNKPTIVSSVTGTAPIVSSGGTTPAISISAATTSAAGSMSSADKLKLDGIADGAEVNQNAFSSIAVSGQTTVAADQESDTLTLAAAGGMTITTDATTGTVTISSKWLANDNVVLNGSRSIDLNGDDFEIINGASSVAMFATSGEVVLNELIASNIQYPTTDGTAGQVMKTDGAGTLSFVNQTPQFFAVESSSSTAYTLVSGDAGKYKRMTATTSVTVTINTSVFSVGDEVLFEQNNTGQITVAAGSGVTLRNSSAFNPRSAERYAVIGLKCVASNEYILTGERQLA